MVIKVFRHFQSIFWLFLVCLLVNSSATANNWASEHFRDHILVGKIWDTGNNEWLTEQQLILQLAEYDYILLGEAHNNEDHHILQAHLLDSIVASGEKPIVVMEMLDKGSWQTQPRSWTNLEQLQEQAKINNDGWPWHLYTPILQVIVKHQLELVAGNIESEDLQEWSKKLGPYTSDEIVNEFSITYNVLEQLKHDIVESHCGYANQDFVNIMVRAQLQRDYVMATSLINNNAPVVLIAGAGHVRNNYAVPMQLLNRYHRVSYISLSFIQVNPEMVEPEEYIDGDPKNFDILYFTPSYTDQDPCVQYRIQLQNMQESQNRE